MKDAKLAKLVADAIAALDRIVVYRDDHPELADAPDAIQAALCQAEIADSALSNVLEDL